MDLDADGQFDILSGSYSHMGKPMAGTFQVLWGKSGGAFKKAETLNGTDGEPLIIPTKGEDDVVEAICTRPWAVDWDGDGDLDLVVGNFAGKFYLFSGEGKGKFSPKPQQLKAGDKPLALKGEHSAHSDPFVVDWDKDGDLDILSGTAGGGVQWAENTAGANKPPVLAAFKDLIAAPKAVRWECRPNEVTAPAGSTRVWATDMNGDGKLDILVGDNISLISPAKDVSEKEFKLRYEAHQKAMTKLNEELASITDDEKRQPYYEKMNKLREQRSEFLEEDRTGFVWLYLQK